MIHCSTTGAMSVVRIDRRQEDSVGLVADEGLAGFVGERQPEGGHDDADLTAWDHAHADHDGVPAPQPERAGDAAEQLGEHGQDSEDEDERQQPHIDEGAQVDLGSCDREEEGREDAHQWPIAVLDLLTHGRLGDDEPDHEGADDGRQAHELRQ